MVIHPEQEFHDLLRCKNLLAFGHSVMIDLLLYFADGFELGKEIEALFQIQTKVLHSLPPLENLSALLGCDPQFLS